MNKIKIGRYWYNPDHIQKLVGVGLWSDDYQPAIRVYLQGRYQNTQSNGYKDVFIDHHDEHVFSEFKFKSSLEAEEKANELIGNL